tara:strand:+ start:8426 stop:9025 length:600 start_codon:yes stop_codon:yes gene_type:complete
LFILFILRLNLMKIHKRLFDIIFSLIALFLLILPILIISILVKISSKGPIFFVSKRVGFKNKIFAMPKFRTMNYNSIEIETDLFTDKQNITKIGGFLRKFSLDEIPQFYSVIIGDMSIVGPRPCLPSQTNLMELRNKHGIQHLYPGITGLAQINGRDNISINQKIKYEQIYKEKLGLIFDIKIIVQTIFKITTNKDIRH